MLPSGEHPVILQEITVTILVAAHGPGRLRPHLSEVQVGPQSVDLRDAVLKGDFAALVPYAFVEIVRAHSDICRPGRFVEFPLLAPRKGCFDKLGYGLNLFDSSIHAVKWLVSTDAPAQGYVDWSVHLVRQRLYLPPKSDSRCSLPSLGCRKSPPAAWLAAHGFATAEPNPDWRGMGARS